MTVNDPTRHIQAPQRPEVKRLPLVRTHKHAFLLLLFYIPLVVIPWVVTMIMVHRPLTRSSWDYAPGFWYKDYKIMRGWAIVIPIMNTVAAVIAVTVTSAVVAQAAVVFAQKRKPGQQLSVKHLFSLADRAWCSPVALPRTIACGKASFKCFVLGTTTLVFLGALQYPLSQILVTWKDIDVTDCHSTGYIKELNYGNYPCDVGYRWTKKYKQIGIDLEPAQLAVIPAYRIISRVSSQLSRYRDSTPLGHLWQDTKEDNDRYGFSDPADMKSVERVPDKPVFIAALPAESTTGVLREHLMRVNSSLSCMNTTLSEFPLSCSGAKPFQASWDYHNINNEYNGTLDVCAPGEQGKHPWTLSRNRQDITEEVWFKYRETYVSEYSEDDEYKNEEVFRCTAQTTRGYFELGNVHNGGRHGPLLDKWPSTGASEFHNYFDSETLSQNPTLAYFPSEEDTGLGTAIPEPDPKSDYDAPNTYTNTTGPLLTSILALFGPDSWSHSILNVTAGLQSSELSSSQIVPSALLQPLCDQTPYTLVRASLYPSYSSATCSRSFEGLRYTLDEFFAAFTDIEYLALRLRAAMYFSNEALLTSHTEGYLPWRADTGREIYFATGWAVRRPYASVAAQIALNLIVASHVLGLLVLAWWLQRHPAWTRDLNALAIARVAIALDPSILPPIRATTRQDSEPLASVDGLIGVHENGTETPRDDPAGGVLQHTTDQDTEMRALSVASTVGKEPTSSAVLAISPLPVYDTSISLGLGAPGVVPRRTRVAASPPVPPPIPSDQRV